MNPHDFAQLFEEFRAPSWAGWRSIAKRITPAVRELFIIAGRGAGKSRFVALLAACFASRQYKLAPGERVYCAVFAPDRKQARVTFRYVVGLLRAVPELSEMIEQETRESLDLSNGVTVEVITASRAAPRGRAYALAVIEEAAFLPQGDSADPDIDVLTAIRPALARVPGSLLAVVSSPYARRGVLYDAWQRYHGKPDSDVVLIQAPTTTLNPTFDRRAIERAREQDPVAAAAEYDAQFRSDLESFVSREVVERAVARGVAERGPIEALRYFSFADAAGGSGTDSMTLAIAHAERDRVVLDAVREVRPRFSPESVCREFSELLKRYRITRIRADRYAGSWPREQFAKHGIEALPAEQNKSQLYGGLLPLLNSGRVELLDHPRLEAQLLGLERRTGRTADSIDHAPGGHDDVVNAAAGALVMALASQRSAAVADVRIPVDGRPEPGELPPGCYRDASGTLRSDGRHPGELDDEGEGRSRSGWSFEGFGSPRRGRRSPWRY